MAEITSVTLFNLFLFFLLPFLFGYLAKKSKINPLVGYILGGLVLGNLFESFLSKEIISNFAYFGIVLLLFTIGLELNFQRVLGLKKFIVIGGLIQMFFSIIFIFLASLIFKFSPLLSFLISLAFSSSSTSLVAKIIQDRGEENSFVGEIVMGVLMFQDLAFIPFLIIFSSITNGNISFFQLTEDIIFSMLKASLLIGAMYFIGKKTIPFFFDQIARLSRELLNLFIILFIFFITYLSTLFQIPILISVFIAGILVSQTEEHLHIFTQIRPFRDLLAVLFFVYIGLNIDLTTVFYLVPKIVLFSITISLIKMLVVLLTFVFFRFHSKTAFALSLFLFQIDEDAFILMFTAFQNKVVSYENFLFVSSTVLLTLILTPVLVNNKDKIYLSIRSFLKKHLSFLEDYLKNTIDREFSPIDILNLKNHVVICGYGRVGGDVGRALLMANIPFIAIDYSYQVVEKAKKEGVNIIYGDPTDIEILDYAEVDNALVLISAVPENLAQETIILNAKKLNPKIIIISRVHQKSDQKRLKSLGVNAIIQPEFEASLSILRKIFHIYQYPKENMIKEIKRLKTVYGL